MDAEAVVLWTQEEVPSDADLLAVWGYSATDVWAVGFGGTVLHYDGIAWTEEVSTTTITLTSVGGLPEDPDADPPGVLGSVFAVGWGGTIIERNAAGTWGPAVKTAGSTQTEDLFSVFVGDNDSALAVGDGGRIWVWDGMIWSLARFAVPGEFSGELIEPKGVLKGVWSGNGNRYYITGSGGAAYRSGGVANSFEALDTRVSDPLRGVWGTGNNNVITVGLERLVLRFSNRWRRVDPDDLVTIPRVFFMDVSGTSQDDVTVVGWQGTVARFDGESWVREVTEVEQDLRGVWSDPATGLTFAVGSQGTILRRDPPPPPDGGVDAGM